MSKSLYSVIETLDTKTGQWEIANLYSKSQDGKFETPQMVTGNSVRLGALFGHDTFDFNSEDEEEDTDNPLSRIADLIDGSTHRIIPVTASTEAKEYYDTFKVNWNGGYEYRECVVYTLRDLEMIELLAGLASPKSRNFYKAHFEQIQWLLYTIMRMEYSNDKSAIRIIIWGI